MSHHPPRIPDLLIEQLLLGEISPNDEAWLRTQLTASELEARLAALRASNAEHAVLRPSSVIVSRIGDRSRVARARADAERAPSRGWNWLVPSLVAALAVMFVIMRPSGPASEGDSLLGPDTTRVKGVKAHLVLHRRAQDAVELLEDGDKARAGDVLQVGYVAADSKHGVILSLDGAHAVTLHFPESVGAATSLVTQGEQLLTHAYELDTAPGFERFVFVTSQRPIDVAAVLESARRLAAEATNARRDPISLAPGLEQRSLVLVKE